MNTTIDDDLNLARERFKQRRFLNMPLAGLLAWTIIGLGGIFLESPQAKSWLLFIATGSIVYIAMLLGKITGDPFFQQEKNPFDRLFFYSILMALLVYSIAIAFFMQDYRSLPMTVGILAGLMWLPFSWIVEHWIGTFHTLMRTLLITLAWFLFPDQSFVIIPAIIAGIYLVSIWVLETRWRTLQLAKNIEQNN
ncbi:MAG TPA: hypothetical protein VL995_00795 [Cellvibrio sp.]|nr:hypothetical protein [Cellvibrio sp.]